MAPHSSTLAWKIPWTEEPGRLQSMGSWRVRHEWATSLSLFTFMHWKRKWQPTPVFLPEESQGRGSLVGFRLWGCTESDRTKAAAARTLTKPSGTEETSRETHATTLINHFKRAMANTGWRIICLPQNNLKAWLSFPQGPGFSQTEEGQGKVKSSSDCSVCLGSKHPLTNYQYYTYFQRRFEKT